MAAIVVCGGSVIGSCVALMLADDGHDVAVLEPDRADAPPDAESAWSGWPRRGVPQFHQPHWLMARFREVCEQELPGLVDALRDIGSIEVNLLAVLPPGITDRTPRDGDDRLRVITARRPVVEAVFATAAARHPRISVQRGRKAAGFIPGAASLVGVPHVRGVRTLDGTDLPADLVVDAMGRRSPAADWATDIGARPPRVEAEDAGFVYYTRYFTGCLPERRGPNLVAIGSFSLITLYGDNDTWSVTIFGSTRDSALKAVRDPACFTRVIAACPMQAHWLDGTPITDVLAMAGVVDKYRRYTVDNRSVVTGLAALGDAWACTNPSAGRGLSVGLAHAQQLRHAVREHLDDPATFAHHWDKRTETHLTPYYRAQVAADRARFAEMEALRTGQQPPPPDPTFRRFLVAATHDPDCYRGLLHIVNGQAVPHDVLSRPVVHQRITEIGDERPPLPPGPDRAQLLELIAG